MLSSETASSEYISRLYELAKAEAIGNFRIETEWGRSFSAGAFGKDFSGLLFNRDNAYAGLLALNRLYPDKMLESLKTIREARRALGFRCFPSCGSRLLGVEGVIVEDIPPSEFFKRHRKASAINKTDDVCWLWCADELLKSSGFDEWEWLYENGRYCFEVLYEPFYDSSDGLYFGQPTFIDVGHNGYPDTWNTPTEENRNRCVWVKAASTNCLYYKGLSVMASVSRRLGHDGGFYRERAERLKAAIREGLIDGEWHIRYFMHRDGRLEARRDALGTAFCVLCGVSDDRRLFEDYPTSCRVGSSGEISCVPLLHPFYERDDGYHNNASWFFADAFFLKAKAIATGEPTDALAREILASAFDGEHFREYRDLRSGELAGSFAQLWTAAAFLGAVGDI